jgi:ribosomal protein S18 acetylase RimI-like enzyme
MEKADSYLMVIAQNDNFELLGQLMVGLNFGDIGVIQAWQPFVRSKVNQNQIALSLIEYSKNIVESHSRSKMEIWIELANVQAQLLFPHYKDWYEQCDFLLTSDEYNMEISTSELKNHPYSLPDDIKVVPMVEIPFEELLDVVYESFRNSKDQWVNDLSDSQIRNVIKSWMKVKESFHPKASIVFMKGGNIVGFNGMEIQKNSIEIGPLGVLPAYRGNSLGKYLILESLKRLEPSDPTIIRLSVSTRNIPAINVYSKLGFKKQHQTLIYSWEPR